MGKHIEDGFVSGNGENIDSSIFQSLFDNSISGILYGNPDDGNILDANMAAAQMFGYSIEELRQLNRNDIFDFKHPSMINSLKKRKAHGAAKGELIGVRKNGERFPCEFSSSIFKNQKGENRTSTTLNDISERKKNEEEINLLLNNTEESFVLLDAKLKIVSFNRQFKENQKKYFYIDVEKGDSILDYTQEKDKNEIENLYTNILNGGVIERDIVLINKDGVEVVFRQFLKPALDFQKKLIGIFITSRDITEKRKAQLKLKNNSELFEKLTSKIPAALYQFEISPLGKMTFPYMSKGINRINPKIDIELVKKDAVSAFTTVYPDDLPNLLRSIELSKNNLTDWELEYRSVLDDNSIIWIKGSSSPELKSDGTITWYGYFQDITEQKNTHEKIRESKERYDIIAKATNDTIWDWDLKTDFIKWNKGIVGVFGYHLNELEMNIEWWFSKIHPKDVIRVRENLNLCISKRESRWEDDYRFICFDGTYKYVHDRGFLVIEAGIPVRMIGAMQDITERKQVEEKYFESELRFKTIFEAEPECVKLVDINGKLVEMNKAGLTMLEANSIEEVNSHSLIEFVLPKYQASYKKMNEQVMEGKESYIEFEAIGLRGTKRWVETNAVPIRDLNGDVTMMLSVTRDISNRKKEEHHLKLLESVITNTNDSVMIAEAEPFDEPGPKIVYVNAAFTKMTGYSSEEVIGKSPRILQGPKTDKDELKRMRECMQRWESCEITVINYKKSGEEFWINLSIKPVADATGWFTHWIAVERDVTERKNNELEREQIIAELSQNNKDLKQFSYVTSHNLRAPIANLLGLTSLIDQYKISNKSLKQIIDGVRQSALMFDDTVKDLSKVLIIKDQTNIIKEEVSFVVVIENVLKQLSIAMDDHTVKIYYEFSDAPFALFTPSYMESVFLNLFTNAIKYQSPKRKLKIDIVSNVIDGCVILKFKDNGIGIDTEKYKDKLFKLYQRFHDNPDGKGLGLYLVKSQLEALGGSIAVESEVGMGTTFIMKFPE